MRIKYVLFDLDGTLLPMDQDEFTHGYFKLLAQKAAPHGYEPKQLVDAIWSGTAAMVRNDGSATNEATFWRQFAAIYGDRSLADKALFDEFYAVEFEGARSFCGYNPKAAETVHALQRMGLRTVLATNPIFPDAATRSRIRWAGLEPSDFELYTTYETMHFCKPNPAYYREILELLDAAPEECLMVGNDVVEDMAAGSIGMQVFLLTDCLINREGADIAHFSRGSFQELLTAVETLLNQG